MVFKRVQGAKCSTRGMIFCTLMIWFMVLTTASISLSASAPKTVAEIALYQGPDRDKILLEGAKKEGQMTLYTSNSIVTNVLGPGFEKKFGIKVLIGRAESQELLKRVMEEYNAGRYVCDVIETSDAAMQIFHREGFFQEYFTPEAAFYTDQVKKKGKTGVYYMADREIHYGLGFNTDAFPSKTAPKTLADLLDPRYKGKMSIVGSSTGVRWIGSILDSMGRDYVEKLSQQNIKVQDMTAAALATLVASGEAPISPTAGETNITAAKKKGAPVEWRPLEPTLTTTGLSGMTVKAPHPFASVLFLDFVHSKEGQQLVIKSEENSPRTDIGSLEKSYKKDYIDTRFPIDEYEKRFNEWEDLLKNLFIKRR
jgi:iron(III) transport system substrate-binding protein